jgi:hypothetical protein
MQTGLHAMNWGLTRLAIAIAGTAVLVLLGYCLLVFGMVAFQAFGQS